MSKPSQAGKLEQKVLLCNEINVTVNNIGHEVPNKAKTSSKLKQCRINKTHFVGPKQEQRSQADEQIKKANPMHEECLWISVIP